MCELISDHSRIRVSPKFRVLQRVHDFTPAISVPLKYNVHQCASAHESWRIIQLRVGVGASLKVNHTRGHVSNVFLLHGKNFPLLVVSFRIYTSIVRDLRRIAKDPSW